MSIAISQKIRVIRELHSLSRAKFAESIGVSARTLEAIENTGGSPRVEVIEKIAEVYREYALWLITGEGEYLAGQFNPGVEEQNKSAFQIIESVDARSIDQIIINPKQIKEVIFLQSVGDDFFVDILGEKVAIESSSQVSRKFNSSAKKRGSFVFGIPQHFGTAVLLVLSQRESRGFPRGVLVKDDSFDLKESLANSAKSNTFLSVQKWFKGTGINKFDIGTIHYKTLRILESESDELKLSDIYPGADDEAIKSLVEWRKIFK
jgi:transcriptional regulator with XRE-family HTH domain